MKQPPTFLKWLHPGLHIKRWVFLAFLGFFAFLVGTGVISQSHPPGTEPPLAIRIAKWIIERISSAPQHPWLRPPIIGAILTVCGALLCLIALGKLIYSLTSAIDPEMTPGDLVDIIYSRRKLAQGQRIVVVGGGTGLSTMLRGLKEYSSNIAAIVTVSDDGGSSGKLQKQLNILPPGDIRNCLVALADSEPQMTELFQYRFRNNVQPEKLDKPDRSNGEVSVAAAGSTGYGEGLRDHAFGNLLIAAMCAINGGDFEKAVRETSRVLNIRGRVLPSTVTPVRLRGEMEDGSFLDGETAIAHSPLKIRRVSVVPNNPCPIDEVIEVLESADVIVLGPGSVFTSIIPNLLVQGIPEAIQRSKSKKVNVCNVMTQPGESDGFSAFDHVKTIERHARRRVFDYVLVNTGQPSPDLMAKYRKTGSVLVEPDTDRIKAEGYRPIPGNFINQTDVVRHNSTLLAEAIMRLIK